MCFRLRPMEDDREWTDDTTELPDSSIVSSQDIDSLLGARVCPFVVNAIPDRFELDKSDDCCLSWFVLWFACVIGEEGRRGERGGGMY